MADTKKLNLEITVDKKALTLLKESTKTTIAEIKALSQQAVTQAKADAQVKIQTEKTAQAQIKADAIKTAIELKANKQKEVIDYKEALRQKIQAERDAQNQIKAQSKLNSNSKTGGNFPLNPNSEAGLKEQIKYWQQYKSTLAGTNPQIGATTKHINQLKTALNNVKGGGASRSDWEHWENLTTVFAGIGTALYGAYMAGQQFISFITDAVKKAAELEVYSKTFIEIAGSTEKANQQLQQLYNASAGNLNETELVKYSNKMRLLGFTVEDTTKLLDIVERKADEVGVTFAEGESALQSFILAGRGRALKELGINLNEVTAEMDSLILASGKSKDAMQSEELEAIRLQAILNKYGDTLTSINQKQKDSGDRIKSLSTLWDKFNTEAGKESLALFNAMYNIVSKTTEGITQLGSAMGISVGKTNALSNSFIDFGKKLSIGMIAPITLAIRAINAMFEDFTYIESQLQDATQGVDNNGTSNIDRPFNPRYDKNTQKIAKRGIGEEQILDKVSGSKGSGTAKTVAEITNEIIRLNKSLSDLQAEQLSLGEGAKGNSIFAIYLQQIQEIQDKLNYLNSPFKDSTGLDFITNLPKFDNSTPIEPIQPSFAQDVEMNGIDKQAMLQEAYDKILNGSTQLLSNVQSTMDILNVGTETFAYKFVGALQDGLSVVNSIVTILNTINQVKQGIGLLTSLFSFIPGGQDAGGLINAGAEGFMFKGGNRNIGNLAGNGGGQSPIVNKIYINSSIDTQKFFSDGVTTFYKNRKLNTAG